MKRFSCKLTFAYFAGVCLAILPLFSCSARIDGSLAANGSAATTVSVSLEPRMTFLIRSLAAAAGQSEGPILDGPAIAGSMSKAPLGNVSASFKNTSPSAIDGTIKITNISRFLAAGEVGGFIVFEQKGSGGRCEIKIDLDNGPALLKSLSPEIADYLSALMAPLATGEKLTKSEYLELVSFVYSKAISDEIASSKIRASINFPGQVKSVKGGTFSGKRANFEIPLIDLLVLETPLSYEVVWN